MGFGFELVDLKSFQSSKEKYSSPFSLYLMLHSCFSSLNVVSFDYVYSKCLEFIVILCLVVVLIHA